MNKCELETLKSRLQGISEEREVMLKNCIQSEHEATQYYLALTDAQIFATESNAEYMEDNGYILKLEELRRYFRLLEMEFVLKIAVEEAERGGA